MIRYPGKIPAGEVRDQAITAMDWFPTVLDYCGVKRPDAKLDGKALQKVIASKDAASPHEIIYFQWQKMWAVRKGDWKVIHQRNGKKQLYNLADEEPERKDYAAEKPDVMKQLTGLHEAWAKDVFGE